MNVRFIRTKCSDGGQVFQPSCVYSYPIDYHSIEIIVGLGSVNRSLTRNCAGGVSDDRIETEFSAGGYGEPSNGS